jgi:hypothetical protein
MASPFDFVAAADTANMQAGGKSMFDGVGDFLTKGTSGAVLSGLYGILNTGVDVVNAVTGSKSEHFDVGNTLDAVDRNWGDYYRDNKSAIDTAGFFVGGLAPGMLAVKGLKAVQAGESYGVFSRVLGYTSRKEAMYLDAAVKELAVEGGTVFAQINKAKYASMAWGSADAVLQTAAFETAAALAMKSSPMLENEDWKHIGWDIAKTSLLGGALGGGINALFTNRFIKDATKAVDAKQRAWDVLTNPGSVDLAVGDRAFAIADSVLRLPREAIDSVVKLSHNGREFSMDLSALADKTLKESTRRGLIEFESTLSHVAPDDATVGLPLAKSLMRVVAGGLESGKSMDAIRQELAGITMNLRKVEGMGNTAGDLTGEIKWLNKSADISKTTDVFTASRVPGAMAYRVVGDESNAKLGTLGKDAFSKEEAWKKGFDGLIDPQTRNVEISPFSSIYKHITPDEAAHTALFYNVRTGATGYTALPTIADIQTPFSPLTKKSINIGGVSAGGKTFSFDLASALPTNPVEVTARHLWADALPVVRGEVNIRDMSVLDALLAAPEKAAPGLKIADLATGESIFFRDIGDFPGWLQGQKIARIKELLEEAGEHADNRLIAYRANVAPDFVDSAVAANFDARTLAMQDNWTVPAASYMERETLVMRYDTAKMREASFQSNAIVAHEVRVKEAVQKAQNASKAVLGKDHDKLISIEASLAREANSTTAGASLFGASNADYTDSLKRWAQYTGLQVANMTTARVNESLAVLQSAAGKLVVNPKAAAEVQAAVTQGRLSVDNWGLWVDPRTGMRSMVDYESLQRIKAGGEVKFVKRVDLSQEAGDFIAAHHQLHLKRVDQQNVLASAQGHSTHNPDRLYFPPVDTARVPFFAFVKQTEGKIFGTSDVAMVTARSAEELQRLTSSISTKHLDLQVVFKTDTEAWHKAKFDYEFSRTMNAPEIDSTLRRSGLLGDYMPNMTPEKVIEDFVQYTQRAETRLVRDAISVNYAQTFAELGALSDRYTAAQTSKFEGLGARLLSTKKDPFGDTIKLALNVSKQTEFTLWHQANEFVDAMGTRAYRGITEATADAREGKISWEDANAALTKFGIGRPVEDKTIFELAQTAPDRNILKSAVNKLNMILATGMLRFDFANSLLNIVSTPIMLGAEVASIRSSLSKDPAMTALFNAQLQQVVPGTAVTIPSTTKLLANAVGALMGKDTQALYARFRDIGTVKGDKAIFHEMVNDLSLTPKLVPSEYAKKVDAWVEKGASITFSNQAEDTTRFVTSHVMMQITDPLVAAGKMSIQEQNAFMTIFTNRVQGNYVASQRPILFQGTIGAAVGLFQTYQFNFLQQLFRHIENKDAKTIAVLAGMQSSLFGLNGLPMFDAINTHIVGNANINEGHKDAYSYAVQAVGKDWGDWLMYGTASAFPLFSDKAPALYTRGDLNPRNALIIPTSPLDVPAVQGSIKVVGNILNMAKQMGNGADISSVLLNGLEHNGLNRPLAGLAQVVKGDATTSQGSLISASSDWDSLSTFSRIAGAKPMDESIGLNTLYRSRAYQAADKQRVDELGQAIKSKLRGNQPLTSEDWIDFQGRYAAAGGRVQGFTQAVQRWDKLANHSVVNEVMRHTQRPDGQRMIGVLGGTPLGDYSNTPAME